MLPGDCSQQKNPLVFLNITIDGESAGRIIIELRSDVVPKTAENFRALCTGEKGPSIYDKPLHFKGVRFHRAVPQFMVQSGDIINGDGTGGESIYGPSFEDENFILKHEAGVVSMANKGKPHTNASQFCITTVPCPQLDGTNVVFGQVLAGMGTVEEMQERSKDGKPLIECLIADCGEVTDDWGLQASDDLLPEHPSDLHHLSPIRLEQLIASVKEMKGFGNGYFSKGQYKAAARKYRKCLRYIRHLYDNYAAQQDSYSDIMSTNTLQCHLNLAACYMKLEDYNSCVQCCTEVLDGNDVRNEKALYRRAQANFALNNYDAALSDLKQAEKVSPNNKAVQKLLEEVRYSNKNYNDIQKQRLSKFFRDQKAKGLSVDGNGTKTERGYLQLWCVKMIVHCNV